MLPVLFLAHGNPMNAVENNPFTMRLKELGQEILPRPEAILIISAHWVNRKTKVSSTSKPSLIYDFFGFPASLYQVEYPCPGSPQTADLIRKQIPEIQEDTQRGIDHGAWTLLKHIYPLADIPVLQLSLDISLPPSEHVELGRQLRFLRKKGVLIVGSGNIVHNLSLINWKENAEPYEWAVRFDHWVKQMLIERNEESLVNYPKQGDFAMISVPTSEHYLPLLYCLGASAEDEKAGFPHEGIVNGSLSMRCVRWG